MQVTLNDRPIDVAVACVTLQDLLAWIEEEKLPRGHVVTSIEVNGQELAEESEDDVLLRNCNTISTVAFRTTRAVDLAREGLEQAVELLPTLSDALKETARLLRDGHTAPGLDLLYECLGHIEWYIGLIAALDIYFGELSAETDEDLLSDTQLGKNISVPGGLPLKGTSEQSLSEMKTFASVENLRSRLVEAQRLQKAEELQRLADLLEHEVLPITRLWSREAPLLLRKVAREGAVA